MDKSSIERYWWSYAYMLMLAGVVFLVDQASKLFVRNYLDLGEVWIPWETLGDYAVIVHTWNTGMTFGFLRGTNGLFIAISEIVCICILFLYPRLIHQHNALVVGLGLGLILGGAAGNMIDRVAIGYVADIFMIDNFPVFNLADASILIGAVILSLSLIFDPYHPDRQT
jgi:signal peptidase II